MFFSFFMSFRLCVCISFCLLVFDVSVFLLVWRNCSACSGSVVLRLVTVELPDFPSVGCSCRLRFQGLRVFLLEASAVDLMDYEYHLRMLPNSS